MRREIYVDYYPVDDETVIILPYNNDEDNSTGISYRYHCELIQLLDKRGYDWCEQWIDPGISKRYKMKNRSYGFLTEKGNMYFVPAEKLTRGAAIRLVEDLRAIVAADCEVHITAIMKRAEPLGVLGEEYISRSLDRYWEETV
jgi:hypothetical protein